MFYNTSNTLKNFLIILRVSRPFLWITLPLVFCLGLAYGRHGLTDSAFRFTPVMIFQMFTLSFPVCLLTFGLNDIRDHESDKINPRKTGMEGILLQPEYHGLVGKAAFCASFVLFGAALITMNPSNIFFTVALIVLSYVYSTPPWRLKTRPPLDAISAGIIGFMAPFAMGYSWVDNAMALPFHAYCFTFCVMGFHMFSTIMDYDVDKQSGDLTFAVAYGKRASALFPAAVFLFTFFFIHIVYVKAFFIFCILLFILVSIISSERIARFSFLSVFLGAIIVVSIWIGSLIFS